MNFSLANEFRAQCSSVEIAAVGQSQTRSSSNVKMQTISFRNDMEAMWVRELARTSLPRLWCIHTVFPQFNLHFDIGYPIPGLVSAFALASHAIP